LPFELEQFATTKAGIERRNDEWPQMRPPACASGKQSLFFVEAQCPCGNRTLTPGNSPTSVFSTHAQTAPISVTVHDL